MVTVMIDQQVEASHRDDVQLAMFAGTLPPPQYRYWIGRLSDPESPTDSYVDYEKASEAACYNSRFDDGVGGWGVWEDQLGHSLVAIGYQGLLFELA